MLLLLAACGDPVAIHDYTAIINVAPGHGTANVGVDTIIQVTFNDDLDESSLAGAMWVEDIAGTPVTALMDYDSSTRTVHVEPNEDLERDSSYNVVVTTGVTGEAYGPVPADITTSFWTIGPGPAGGNQAPVAVISELDAVCVVGEPYPLDGEASYDPDDDELTYLWRIVTGPGSAFVDLSDQPTASLNTDDGAVFVIGLVVYDGAIESSEDYLRVQCFE